MSELRQDGRARRFVRQCERIAGLYDAVHVDRIQQACPRFEVDAWDSLRFFLVGYAFERTPTSPESAAAAVDAIDACRRAPLGPTSAHDVWASFVDRLEGKPSHRSNPLCPSGTTYVERRRKRDESGRRVLRPVECRVQKDSIVELVHNGGDTICLVPWMREHIVGGTLDDAAQTLTRVNGIGEKMLAYFFRDVAAHYALTSNAPDPRLIPQDRWTTYVTSVCEGVEEPDPATSNRFLADNAEVAVRASQGIWYFCTQIAGSARYRIHECIEDPAFFEQLLTGHLMRLSALSDVVAQIAADLDPRPGS